MPKYIDKHAMGKLTPEQLKHLQTAPKDEFGVTHHDIFFNAKEDWVYCVLECPRPRRRRAPPSTRGDQVRMGTRGRIDKTGRALVIPKARQLRPKLNERIAPASLG